MVTADVRIHDEIDRSNLKVIGQYKSRTAASAFGGKWMLSNPSVPDLGIDAAYKISDQKRWHIICHACKHEQPLSYDENIDEARKVFCCRRCQEELTDIDRALGRWIPTYPGRPVSGYHISQLMAPFKTAADLVDERHDPLTDPEYYANFVLGEPYSGSDAVVDQSLILDNWTPKPLEGGPYYLGLDVGRLKHYVLGNAQGIMRIGTFMDWNEFDELLLKYKPICVMDALPETTMSDHYRKKYPGKVFTCFYNKDRAKASMVVWGKDKEHGVVWADRSRLIGRRVDAYLRGDVVVAVEPGQELQRFVKHWCSVRRLPEKDELGRVIRHEWTTISSEDHYQHADNYYWIARSRIGKTEHVFEGHKKADIVKEVQPGEFQLNLKEAMISSGQYEDNTHE